MLTIIDCYRAWLFKLWTVAHRTVSENMLTIMDCLGLGF